MALAAVDNEGAAHLFGMWVQPETRGSIAATLLCDACVAWAAEHDRRSIELSVVVDNDRAAALYRKAGFVETGTVMEDFGERSLPVLVMRRFT